MGILYELKTIVVIALGATLAHMFVNPACCWFFRHEWRADRVRRPGRLAGLHICRKCGAVTEKMYKD